MACPRDTKNLAGEVHMMEEDSGFLVDANGLAIPQGEISVYKDSSGELVLVVHAEEASQATSDQTAGREGVAAAPASSPNKKISSPQSAGDSSATSSAAADISQTKASEGGSSAEVGAEAPETSTNKRTEKTQTSAMKQLEQSESGKCQNITASPPDNNLSAESTKAVRIVDEPMEVDVEQHTSAETMHADPPGKSKDTPRSRRAEQTSHSEKSNEVLVPEKPNEVPDTASTGHAAAALQSQEDADSSIRHKTEGEGDAPSLEATAKVFSREKPVDDLARQSEGDRKQPQPEAATYEVNLDEIELPPGKPPGELSEPEVDDAPIEPQQQQQQQQQQEQLQSELPVLEGKEADESTEVMEVKVEEPASKSEQDDTLSQAKDPSGAVGQAVSKNTPLHQDKPLEPIQSTTSDAVTEPRSKADGKAVDETKEKRHLQLQKASGEDSSEISASSTSATESSKSSDDLTRDKDHHTSEKGAMTMMSKKPISLKVQEEDVEEEEVVVMMDVENEVAISSTPTVADPSAEMTGRHSGDDTAAQSAVTAATVEPIDNSLASDREAVSSTVVVAAAGKRPSESEPSTSAETTPLPKRKRGRPSKKQHQQQQTQGASSNTSLDGRDKVASAKPTARPESVMDTTIHHNSDDADAAADDDRNDIDSANKGKPHKKTSLTSEPRRSGRERHVKRYEDYIEENWSEDNVEEEGGEGDGLTPLERELLDVKLRKQRGTFKGQASHEASRNAASWVKKCNIFVGETALSKRPYVKCKRTEPVKKIDQLPPRPSQAIIRRYLPLETLETEEQVAHCKIMYRPQDTFGIDMAQKRKRGMQDDYTCCKCQYWTSRINNYVRHLRDLCPFNKDFFAWDEGTLKEVTRGQKATAVVAAAASSSGSVSKKVDHLASDSVALGRDLAHRDGNRNFGVDATPVGDKKAPSAEAKDSSARDSVPQVARGRARRSGGATTGADQRHSAAEDEADAAETEVSARLGFRKHDIVWADLGKGVHWPALVLSIRNRGLQGKARVNTIQVKVHLIHDGSSRTLPLPKVDGFDSSRRQSYLEAGRGGRGNLAVEHARAAQKADKFLRERVLGANIDPIRFFCLGETKVIEEHEGSSSSTSDDDEAALEDGESGSRPQWALPVVEPLPALTGEQTKNLEASISQALHIVKKAKRHRKQSNTALVDFIVKGKVEPHLVGIYRGTVPSDRHASFMSSDDSRRAELKESPSWGPVDDPAQQEAVYEYCHDLLERSATDGGTTSGTENGEEQLDKCTYAFEVFCPEAITKAISRLALVDLEAAANIFYKGWEQSRQFVEIQELAAKHQEEGRAMQRSKEAAESAEPQQSEETGVETTVIEIQDQQQPEQQEDPEQQQKQKSNNNNNEDDIQADEDDDDDNNNNNNTNHNDGDGDNEDSQNQDGNAATASAAAAAAGNDNPNSDQPLNSGEVVREELARLGVDNELLEVLDNVE